MADNKELASMIAALAAAAQSGAPGTLAKAALNIMMASEAVARLRDMDVEPALIEGAEQALRLSEMTFTKASQLPQAIEEAKQDIKNCKDLTYRPGDNTVAGDEDPDETF